MKQASTSLLLLSVLLVAAAQLSAQIIIPLEELDFSTWHRRSTSDGTGSGGALNAIDPDKTNAPTLAMIRTDPADPSTWVLPGQSWTADWQGHKPAFSSLTNSTYTNLPWMVFDLGREAVPDKMFIWNVSESTGWSRGIRHFYLFYSSAPTVPVTWWLKSAALPSTPTDYDFFSGGWTQYGGVHSIDRGANDGFACDLILDFSNSIPSARYIGICAITNWGASGSWEVAGISTAVFMRVPPPAGTVLLVK